MGAHGPLEAIREHCVCVCERERVTESERANSAPSRCSLAAAAVDARSAPSVAASPSPATPAARCRSPECALSHARPENGYLQNAQLRRVRASSLAWSARRYLPTSGALPTRALPTYVSRLA
eukprot:2184673-Pleurochrysis_carterae.AAC.7